MAPLETRREPEGGADQGWLVLVRAIGTDPVSSWAFRLLPGSRNRGLWDHPSQPASPIHLGSERPPPRTRVQSLIAAPGQPSHRQSPIGSAEEHPPRGPMEQRRPERLCESFSSSGLEARAKATIASAQSASPPHGPRDLPKGTRWHPHRAHRHHKDAKQHDADVNLNASMWESKANQWKKK